MSCFEIILEHFSELYDIMNDEERKELLAELIQEIQIYPEGENDCPLKSIKFNFPVFQDGKEVEEIFLNRQLNVDKSRLIEITDSSVLSRIDALIPLTGAAGVSIGNIARQSKETLYKVVLKNGGKLVDSKTMEGAKRAMVMGKNGIAENANLLAVEPDKTGMIANAGACVFSVASMVVGQYYMQ